MDGLRSWKEPLIDEHAKTLGAECTLSHIQDHDVGPR
jgi:hypothetical protein